MKPLRLLMIEDNPSDADLILRQLESAGFDPTWRRVDNEADFLAALDPTLDVILADFNLPAFDAPRALALLKERPLDVPVIVVSGSIGEETAVRVLQSGAADYLLKDRLARLGQAIQRAIDERQLQRAKRQAEQALRAAEERTQFALNAARVGTWEADLITGAIRWSDTLEALHGLSPGAFGGTFEAFLELIHADDHQHVQEAIEKAMRDRTDSNLVYRTRWRDGTMHWISWLGRTFYDEAGRPRRAAGIGIDVSERRRLEEEYRQAQKMEAVGQLAGGVAHDFNNLLTAIQGYCELLGDALQPESPHQADLREIRRAADRAASLTRQLLAFSRRQILEPRVLDLRDSLHGIEPMLRRLIGEHIEVVVRSPGEIGRIKADPGQIEQVILNLAVNARDAMPQGGTLLLELGDVELDESYAGDHPGTKPGAYVMLAVSDTGVGMDAATRARIFEPFFTTKEQGRGTGLGLSTVYGIVKQSEGNIWVYSEPGRGSTFKVYLPRVDDPADRPVAPPAPGALTGSETILVVEDEPSVRELVRKVLGRRGYRVLAAATPDEALAIARRRTGEIDLLMSDVVLPQMSGRSLVERITAIQPEIRVLYISGYTDDVIVYRGVLERDMPFLQKPFTGDALAHKVRETLNAAPPRPV